LREGNGFRRLFTASCPGRSALPLSSVSRLSSAVEDDGIDLIHVAGIATRDDPDLAGDSDSFAEGGPIWFDEDPVVDSLSRGDVAVKQAGRQCGSFIAEATGKTAEIADSEKTIPRSTQNEKIIGLRSIVVDCDIPG